MNEKTPDIPINPVNQKPYRLVISSREELVRLINSDTKNNHWNLENLLITCPISFNGTIFSWNISFSESTFLKKVVFYKTEFLKTADFSLVQFSWDVDFSWVTFRWNAHFGWCNFLGITQFMNTRFGKESIFIYSKVFKSITFLFSIFEQSPLLIFQECKFLDLTWVVFEKWVIFSEIRLVLSDTNKETARIIKNELQKIGDQIETLKWHALEMRKHKEEIRKKNDIKNIFVWKKIKEISIGDEIILNFNWITSNYWLSWLLPLFWICIINLIFILSLNSFSIQNFEIFINQYILSFNITKSLKELSITNEFLFDTQTWESLSFLKNVLVSMLIYQLIAGFRKLTRKA